MNDLFFSLGIQNWKGAAGALVLPPLPLLLLVLLGALLLWARRRAWGGTLFLIGFVLLWLSTTQATAGWLTRSLTPSPPVLDAARLARLASERQIKTAIVVLGSGRDQILLEYGDAGPKPLTLERLRYGLWLARRTGLPVAYSGGLAPGSLPGPTEAAVARRLAAEDFRQPLAWVEDRALNTVDNARYTVALLRPAGVQRIVLVTHGFHMRRSLRAFERALADSGAPITLLPAPMGVHPLRPLEFEDWLPNLEAAQQVRWVVREWVGWLAGA